MRRKKIKFICIQLEFSSIKSSLFNHKKPSDKAKELISEYFSQDQGLIKLQKGGRSKKIYYLDVINNRDKIILFKIGKDKTINLSFKDKEHIKTKSLETCPFIYGAILLDKQLLLIQLHGEIFYKPKGVINTLIWVFENNLKANGIELNYNYVKEEGSFWKIIDQYNKMNNIEIILDSPNFLGSTHQSYKKLAEEVKKETNANSFALKFKNKEGELTLPTEDPLLNDISSVIDKGGGNLKIHGEVGESKSYTNLNEYYKKYVKFIDKKYWELKVPEIISIIRNIFYE